MSFRTWLHITAFGIILVVISALAWASWDLFSTYEQGHADERNNATQYEASASEQSPESCKAIMDEIGVFGWLACLAESVSVDGGVKQAEYDLKAQQDMAAWAFGMLLVTVWLSVITLVGVLFVGWTLRETRRAVKAADDAVRVTREIGESQVRAYLSATRCVVPEGRLSHVLVTVKNFGQSPAKDVRCIANFSIEILDGTFGSARTIRHMYSSDHTNFGAIEIEAGAESEVEISLATGNLRQGIDNQRISFIASSIYTGKNALAVGVVIEWKDVFGKGQAIYVVYHELGRGSPYRPRDGKYFERPRDLQRSTVRTVGFGDRPILNMSSNVGPPPGYADNEKE